jgi:putative endonuclease
MSYSVYLLKSLKDNNYYIGYSEDVKKRFKEHQDGKVQSTKSRRPFKLIGYEKYKTKNQARYREHQLKKSAWQRKQFINKLDKSNANP